MKKNRLLPLVFFSMLLASSLGAAFFFIFLQSGGELPIAEIPVAGPEKSLQQVSPESLLAPAATTLDPQLPAGDAPPEPAAATGSLLPENFRQTLLSKGPVEPPEDEKDTAVAGRPDEPAEVHLPDRLWQDAPTTEGESKRSSSTSDASGEQSVAMAGDRPESDLPRVAIVIDDMGYERRAGEQLLALDLDLTFSFLPHAPHTRALSRLAREIGRDVLLHLPLEPIDTGRWDPGPGALYLAMPVEDLHRNLQENLAAVPMAIGVSNHMGSRFTANPQAMATVMTILQPRGLFFLDSLTTADSSGYQVAREFGLPAVRRDIFLDNDRTVEVIKGQLAALIRLARGKGSAIAIAHPHPGTIAALLSLQEQLRTNVKVVGIQNLVY